MFKESELLPLSGLQHLIFCVRQCALIHVEQAWRENVLTAEGRLLHERVDSAESESRKSVRTLRGVPLRSLKLGLVGRADVVELRRVHEARQGLAFTGLEGFWTPVPVEYKRGKPKFIDCDRVQLCAQALCLEEMLGGSIRAGELYYGSRRRRFDVELDTSLRRKTEEAAMQFHELVVQGRTPLAYRERKCSSCSLLDICLPPTRQRTISIQKYLSRMLPKNTP